MKKSIFIVGLLLLLVVGGSIGIYYFAERDPKDIGIDVVDDDKVYGSSYRVGYLSNVESKSIDMVISKYDDFLEYFNTYTNFIYDGYGNVVSSSTDEILNKYNKDYFKDKSLAVKYLVMNSGSNTIEEVYGFINDDEIVIRYLINYPEIGTDDMSGFFIIIEVPKSVGKIALN